MSGTGPVPGRRVVLVTGLSGAGKASTLRVLEDLGFDTVDNPPLAMLDDLVARAASAQRPVAVGVDARTMGFDSDAVLQMLGRLRADATLQVALVFVWADDVVLQRRFTETRRRHPLAESGRVQDGIVAEQLLTARLREAADWVLDTSDLPLADLRRIIAERFDAEAAMQRPFSLVLVSFAFPAGLPREADMVIDARFLRNPHYVTALRPLTGLDEPVGSHVEADPDFPAFFAKLRDLLELLVPRFVREGKKYCTVAVGCTGGRHRSVYVVRKLAQALERPDWTVSVTHRELQRGTAGTGGARVSTASTLGSADRRTGVDGHGARHAAIAG
jgi:UPF0042 nucleotide-binding protein